MVPKQFRLEVEKVALLADGDLTDNPNIFWARESFTIGKKSAVQGTEK